MDNHPMQDRTYPDSSEYMERLLDWAEDRERTDATAPTTLPDPGRTSTGLPRWAFWGLILANAAPPLALLVVALSGRAS